MDRTFGKRRSLSLALLALGSVCASPQALAIHAGDEPVGRGPFRIRNQFPFSLQFLGHIADDAHGLEPGNFEVNVNVTWANTFVGNARLRRDRPAGREDMPLGEQEFQDFVAANPDRAAFFFDGEIVRTSLNLYYGFHDRFQLGVEVPFLSMGGGELDGFIQNFHDNFGFSNAGRDAFPRDSFQYALSAGGNTTLSSERPDGLGLGDITLRAKIKLLKEVKGHPALALAVAYKLPTGDVDEFLGSGHPDYGVNALLSKAVSRRGYIYGNLGYVRLGDWALLPDLETSDIYSFLAGYEHATTARLSLVGQVLVSSSPFREVAGEDLGGMSYEATAGIKYDFHPSVEFVFSFTENFLNFDSSPDIGPHFGLVCLF